MFSFPADSNTLITCRTCGVHLHCDPTTNPQAPENWVDANGEWCCEKPSPSIKAQKKRAHQDLRERKDWSPLRAELRHGKFKTELWSEPQAKKLYRDLAAELRLLTPNQTDVYKAVAETFTGTPGELIALARDLGSTTTSNNE